MKKILMILAVLMVMVAVMFSPLIVVAFPPLPDDLNIVQPDPALLKELAAFLGKWEAVVSIRGRSCNSSLIVERINETEASLYIYSDHPNNYGWKRITATVVKERGKYKIWFFGVRGVNEIYLKGDKLMLSPAKEASETHTRVQ